MFVRKLSREEHLNFVRSRPSVSFLQCPSWGGVKSDWQSESLGWFTPGNEQPVGAALVLYRKMPKLKRYLAYLPEGPDIDWSAADLASWLEPLVAHLKRKGAFGVKMGPPVTVRHWEADTIKSALGRSTDGGAPRKLADLTADSANPAAAGIAETLRGLGWKPPATGKGFSAGQPQFVFQLPLDGRSEDDLLKGFNQQWRRNIKKAEKAGVQVDLGGYPDLPAFHDLYKVTAARDGFTPRGLAYFQRMWNEMREEDPDRIRLYLARHEGRLLAATTLVRVGTHAWYSYGASSNEGRDVRPSNAIQWRMMRDSLSAGATVYDLRGITDTLDESDKLFGLIQFKVGTGGRAVEYLGEWDLPVNRLLFSAFHLYMSRR